MEATFITIHDLSDAARILYCSDSIVDILGHTPDEVLYRSCWDFFHSDELPWAKTLHGEAISLEKAAVLAYCQLRGRNDEWISCECCFSVCYDVLVGCTSVYDRSTSSQRRAVAAPIVRRLFTTSEKDPRYHMLAHLSSKFRQDAKSQSPEPRAALFLNRFTRTLTIMYATNGIEKITGISSEEMKGQSFYYCIAESCLEAAVNCLETAKGNNSIAYLRFWFRDPRQNDTPLLRESSPEVVNGTEDGVADNTSSEDGDIQGGVLLDASGPTSAPSDFVANEYSYATSSSHPVRTRMDVDTPVSAQLHKEKSGSSGESTHPDNTTAAIFGTSNYSSPSSASSRSRGSGPRTERTQGSSSSSRGRNAIELEAVVSCASDGLVVCLRRARPLPPQLASGASSPESTYPNGLFAAPWATEPIYIATGSRQYRRQRLQDHRQHKHALPSSTASTTHTSSVDREQTPAQALLMTSIREVAAFAWALVGINGSLTDYSRGQPKGNAQPQDETLRDAANIHRANDSNLRDGVDGESHITTDEDSHMTNGTGEA